MTRSRAWLGTFVFLLIAPGVVAGLLPWLISGWVTGPPLFGLAAGRVAGLVLIVPALAILLEAFVRFAREGLGTPAPLLPAERLVVRGSYRFVRNPMYLAVLALIWGQALVLGSGPLVLYGAVVALGFYAFVIGYEEPTLRRQFGSDYEDFCRHVPRWLPRLTPWPGPVSGPGR
jgi:protein-S-isoprenylcysteine O-methyltransferase Ste14